MKKNYRLAAFLCAALMCASMAGCGGKTQTTFSESSEDSSEESTGSSAVSSSAASSSSSFVSADSSSNTVATRNNGTSTTRAAENLVVVSGDDDSKVYPNFGGKTITVTINDASEQPALGNSTMGDSLYYALQWAEEKYNCTVQYVCLPQDKLYENFVASCVAGTYFTDVMMAHCWNYYNLITKDSSTTMLEPLTSYYESMDPSLAARWDTSKSFYRGDIYGIDANNSSIVWPTTYLIYNTTLLNSLKLDDPQALARNGQWTWDKFREYCAAAATVDGTKGVSAFRLDSLLAQSCDFEAIVKGTKDGATYYKNGYTYPDSSKALSMLELIQEMYMDGSVLGDSVSGLQPCWDAEAAFKNGTLMFLCCEDARAALEKSYGMTNFKPVTLPTQNADSTQTNSWINSYMFWSIAKSHSTDFSTADLVSFWMDAQTTWDTSRGDAYYNEDTTAAIEDKAAKSFNSVDDAQFLYDMGSTMKYKYDYTVTLNTNGDDATQIYMPVLRGEKSPSSVIAATDSLMQSYIDKAWN